MAECRLLLPSELAVWRIVGGPYASQEDCLANCGSSSSQGSSAASSSSGSFGSSSSDSGSSDSGSSDSGSSDSGGSSSSSSGIVSRCCNGLPRILYLTMTGNDECTIQFVQFPLYWVGSGDNPDLDGYWEGATSACAPGANTPLVAQVSCNGSGPNDWNLLTHDCGTDPPTPSGSGSSTSAQCEPLDVRFDDYGTDQCGCWGPISPGTCIANIRITATPP